MNNIITKLERYKGQFDKLGNSQKNMIGLILLFAFIFGLFLAVGFNNLKPTPHPLTSSGQAIIPSPTSLPAVLSLETSARSVKVGEQFDVNIKLNTFTQGVEAADFVLKFDPDYLSVSTVSAGAYFGNYPINEIGQDFVQLSGVASYKDDKLIVPKGEGVVGSITFQALQATESASISFDKEKTIVAARGTNVLGEMKDLTIKILEF